MRREFTLVLALGAAGAGLVVLAVRQAWARAVFIPPRPLPAQDFAVTGQQLVPLAGALALAALACLAAVIATRSVVRRAAGVLLAVLGAGVAAAASAGLSAPAVLAAARASAAASALGGSTTSGTTSSGGTVHAVVIAGSVGHAVMAGAPWRAVAIAGAVAIFAAGLATVWRGPRWPVMSARFDRPRGRGSLRGRGGLGGKVSPQDRGGHRGAGGYGGRESPVPGMSPPGENTDSATMWESLSRDVDPTEQLDGGPRS